MKPPDPFPVAVREERRLDRRRFLCVAGSAALVTVAGERLGRGLEKARTRELTVSLDGAVPRIGEALAAIDPAGGEALVVRLDESTVVAFDRRCPHLGCPVLWSADRERFECPCHHAAFDARTGEVLFGPPRRGLAPATIDPPLASLLPESHEASAHERSRDHASLLPVDRPGDRRAG